MRRQRPARWALALITLLVTASGGIAIASSDRASNAITQLWASGARVIRASDTPASGGGQVTSTEELISALKSARGGETILLAPGVYSGLKFKIAPTFVAPVTITSADPARPATITDFTLVGVEGLHFRKLVLQALDHPDKIANDGSFVAFKIARGNDVTFDTVSVRGSLDGNPSNDVSGIQIRNSRNIRVVNSEFQQLERALAVGQTKGVTVSNNRVHDIRSDGFNFAEVTDVELVGNVMWNFLPIAKDHPDAIQFWTSRTTTPSQDIKIASNVVHRGVGAYTQGIFLRDQLGTLPYERVTITDNLVIGTGYNGLRITGAVDLTIDDNELVTFAGDNNTFFLVKKADRFTARNNRATAISIDESTNVVQQGNKVTKPVKDKGRAALTQWISRHPDLVGGVQAMISATAASRPDAQRPATPT